MKINAIGHLVKTNPIQTQSNPISSKAQMNVNSLITKDYIKYDDFTVRKNKPNSNPILVDSCWSLSRIRCGVGMTMLEDNA